RSREAGDTSAVTGWNWLFVDIDVGDVGHAKPTGVTMEEALERVRRVLPPTAIIKTGGGVHAYWALKDTPTPEHWQDLARRIAHAVGGAVAATAPPRILRFPGTANFKTGEPRPVEVIKFSGRLADLSEVRALPPTPEKEARPASRALPPRDTPFERAK